MNLTNFQIRFAVECLGIDKNRIGLCLRRGEQNTVWWNSFPIVDFKIAPTLQSLRDFFEFFGLHGELFNFLSFLPRLLYDAGCLRSQPYKGNCKDESQDRSQGASATGDADFFNSVKNKQKVNAPKLFPKRFEDEINQVYWSWLPRL